MILYICSIRDSATETFARPIFVQNSRIAVRSFTDEVNRAEANNDLNKHPDDFTLFELGTFDDQTGQFSGNIVQLARAKDIIKEA